MPEENEGSKAGWWIAGAIIIVILIGAYIYLSGGSASNDTAIITPENSATPPPSAVIVPPTQNEPITPIAPASGSSSTAPMPVPAPTPTPVASAVKTFTVEGSNYSFSVPEIRVNKGDTVKIVFTNKNGIHNWVIDEFSAHTPQISSGQSATVQFVADKAGTFEYYCSVGNHRQMGMKGNLIVE
jgi:plastocyanin